MPYETVVYSRQKLYEEIWKEPVHEVAKRYDVSDVALANVCRKMNIPRPSRGYWARLKAGHKVEPVSLPPLKAGEKEERSVTRWKEPPPTPVSPEEAAFRARPEFHAKRVELPFELALSPVLEKPHVLVAQAMKALRQAKPDRDGLVHTQVFPLSVSPNQVDRVLRLVDALLKGVERAGHRVSPLDIKRYNERARFIVNGVAIEFSVKERLVRSAHVPIKGELYAPKWDLAPSGDLRFRLEWNRTWHLKREWEENSRLRLEDCINSIFQEVLQIPETERASEAERLAREQLRYEASERRRREEEKRAEEQRRADALVDMARRWKEACMVREFAASVREQAIARLGPIEPGNSADRWLAFATSVADRIDPMSELFASPPTSRPSE